MVSLIDRAHILAQPDKIDDYETYRERVSIKSEKSKRTIDAKQNKLLLNLI